MIASNSCTFSADSAFEAFSVSPFAKSASSSVIRAFRLVSVAADFSLSSNNTFSIAFRCFSRCLFSFFCSALSSGSAPTSSRALASSPFKPSISAVISVHAADAR